MRSFPKRIISVTSGANCSLSLSINSNCWGEISLAANGRIGTICCQHVTWLRSSSGDLRLYRTPSLSSSVRVFRGMGVEGWIHSVPSSNVRKCAGETRTSEGIADDRIASSSVSWFGKSSGIGLGAGRASRRGWIQRRLRAGASTRAARNWLASHVQRLTLRLRLLGVLRLE